MTPDSSGQPHLLRRFGLLQATALNMTNMIGVGPFITIPALMSAISPGGPQAMIGWLAALLLAMMDGMVWSELAAAMPGSGGSYVYLREAFGARFGRLMAFLFIWQFILSGPLEIASGIIGMQEYVHYAIPGSLEAYYQEAGRAGRDGDPSRCVLLFNASDRRTHRYFIGKSFAGARTQLMRKGLSEREQAKRLRALEARKNANEDKLERMVLYAQSALCRWRALLEYFEEPDLDPEFRCGTCDACAHPVEAQRTPPDAAPEVFPRPADSPLPEPDEASAAEALCAGQRVEVPEYGEGEIAALNGDKVDVVFADGAVRKFKTSFVTPI